MKSLFINGICYPSYTIKRIIPTKIVSVYSLNAISSYRVRRIETITVFANAIIHSDLPPYELKAQTERIEGEYYLPTDEHFLSWLETKQLESGKSAVEVFNKAMFIINKIIERHNNNVKENEKHKKLKESVDNQLLDLKVNQDVIVTLDTTSYENDIEIGAELKNGSKDGNITIIDLDREEKAIEDFNIESLSLDLQLKFKNKLAFVEKTIALYIAELNEVPNEIDISKGKLTYSQQFLVEKACSKMVENL